MMSSVDSQTSHIQNVMNEFKREQSWMSRINMDVDAKENGKAEVNFEWQIKELHMNSEVVFNYKIGEAEEYRTVPAVEKQNGLFHVTVPVYVDLEPVWEVHVMNHGDKDRQVSKKAIEEQFKQFQLQYFVSVSYDDVVKSGEIHTTNLGKVGTQDYGILETMIDITNENYHVSVLNPVTSSESSVFLEEVYLLKYQDGILVEDEQLITNDQANSQRNMPVQFRLDQPEKLEYTSLVIKVVYSNGKEFEKEVYSKS